MKNITKLLIVIIAAIIALAVSYVVCVSRQSARYMYSNMEMSEYDVWLEAKKEMFITTQIVSYSDPVVVEGYEDAEFPSIKKETILPPNSVILIPNNIEKEKIEQWHSRVRCEFLIKEFESTSDFVELLSEKLTQNQYTAIPLGDIEHGNPFCSRGKWITIEHNPRGSTKKSIAMKEVEEYAQVWQKGDERFYLIIRKSMLDNEYKVIQIEWPEQKKKES